MSLPRVATIQDLSGVGRCSLSAAIPVLSAMGVQACPLPTAVLSNQTGFESYAALSLTGQLASAIAEWKGQGLAFDAVSTGFLMDPEQAGLVGDFISFAKGGGGLVVIDPVMGDEGSLYPVFDAGMVDAFRRLVGQADLITPNLTEACLLAGVGYPGRVDSRDSLVWEIAGRLCEMGPSRVVITGIDGGEGEICNIAYTAREDRRVCLSNRRIGGSYSGTGDILTAILTAGLLRGEEIEQTLRLAGGFFEKAIARSLAEKTDPREGVAFEPYLHLLTDHR